MTYSSGLKAILSNWGFDPYIMTLCEIGSPFLLRALSDLNPSDEEFEAANDSRHGLGANSPEWRIRYSVIARRNAYNRCFDDVLFDLREMPLENVISAFLEKDAAGAHKDPVSVLIDLVRTPGDSQIQL